MLWSNGCENIEEYYKKCIGVPLQLLPTVLGLKLAVDLELGSKYVIVTLKIYLIQFFDRFSMRGKDCSTDLCHTLSLKPDLVTVFVLG